LALLYEGCDREWLIAEALPPHREECFPLGGLVIRLFVEGIEIAEKTRYPDKG